MKIILICTFSVQLSYMHQFYLLAQLVFIKQHAFMECTLNILNWREILQH
jgi:hypothetical protein